jgi:general stress protein YciG
MPNAENGKKGRRTMRQEDELREQSSVRMAEESSEVSAASKPRGFAAMDHKLVTELAQRGGRAAHRAGTAHQFTSDEARLAGRKGGIAAHARRLAKRADTLAPKT